MLLTLMVDSAKVKLPVCKDHKAYTTGSRNIYSDEFYR